MEDIIKVKCPICDGIGDIPIDSEDSIDRHYRTCPLCLGHGFVEIYMEEGE